MELSEKQVDRFTYCVLTGDFGEVAEAAHGYFQRFDVRVFETQRLSTQHLSNGDVEMVIRRLAHQAAQSVGV